jgi:rfaE bifunctional protein kinase chain/domain
MQHADRAREGKPRTIDRARLVALLEAIRRVRIGILGDFTLDGYWWVDMTRAQLSREAPLFNHPVVRETYSAGGCANVAVNVAALRPQSAWAFTVLADDWRGPLLRRVLTDAGLRLDGVLTGPADWVTPFYGKVILTGYGNQQEDARVDFVNSRPLPAALLDALVQQVADRLAELDAVIVADYQVVGVVPPRVAEALNRLAEANPQIIFAADSRENIGQFRAMVIKPNDVEATHMWFPDRDAGTVMPEELIGAGRRVAAACGRPVYITRGDKGALLCTESNSDIIPAVPVPPPIDTVGAGDTFLAALTTALAAGATPWEAGCLATLAAAVTIRKLRTTGTATPEEILAAYDSFVESGG